MAAMRSQINDLEYGFEPIPTRFTDADDYVRKYFSLQEGGKDFYLATEVASPFCCKLRLFHPPWQICLLFSSFSVHAYNVKITASAAPANVAMVIALKGTTGVEHFHNLRMDLSSSTTITIRADVPYPGALVSGRFVYWNVYSLAVGQPFKFMVFNVETRNLSHVSEEVRNTSRRLLCVNNLLTSVHDIPEMAMNTTLPEKFRWIVPFVTAFNETITNDSDWVNYWPKQAVQVFFDVKFCSKQWYTMDKALVKELKKIDKIFRSDINSGQYIPPDQSLYECTSSCDQFPEATHCQQQSHEVSNSFSTPRCNASDYNFYNMFN